MVGFSALDLLDGNHSVGLGRVASGSTLRPPQLQFSGEMIAKEKSK